MEEIKNNCLISIVVPVYNLEKCLASFVKSLINQTYKNIEIILVDDGSTDASGKICDELSKHDKRVITIHQINSGSGPARNAGIEASSGRFVYFPDPDDEVNNNAINTMVYSLNKKDDLLVFGYCVINKNKNVVFEKHYDNCTFDADYVRKDYYLFFGMERTYSIQGAPWNKLFSLEIIKKNNIRYPNLRRHQDDAFISIYMCYCNQVHFINQVLYTYRMNDLRKEWDKFPMNYVDNVVRFYKIRKATILKWNPADIKTRNSVINECLSKSIKALELSFSPKMKLSKKERKQWLKNAINELGIIQMDISQNKEIGKYHKLVYKTIIKKHINSTYFLLHLKVLMEKNGFVGLLKKGHI